METTTDGHQPVAAHLWNFAREHDRLRSAADQLDAFLRELMDEATIKVYRIDSRAKSLDSYQQKSERIKDGRPKYSSPADQIEDCIAARIIVFTNEARDRACERVREIADGCVQHNPGVLKSNGYDSEHFTIPQIASSTPQLAGKTDLVWFLDSRPALEIQVRTVAGHAWAEYEHDIRYKHSGYGDLPLSVREKVDQLFTEAGGLRKNFDTTFGEIQQLLESSDGTEDPGSGGAELNEAESTDTQVEIDSASLLGFLEAQYPDALPTRDGTLAWLVRILEAVGFSTINEIEASLSNIDSEHVASLMDYQFEPTTARRLDDDLLAALGERYIALTGPGLGRGGRDRTQLLEWRLRRVRKKIFIYEVTGDPRLEDKHLSAARTFREVARLVAEELGLSDAVITGAVSLTEEGLNPSARARKVSTSDGDLWVATNLNRSEAERLIEQLLGVLTSVHITVRRAGETLFESPASASGERVSELLDEF
ncbi:hypothetical protein SANBI_001611 [Sanguibacter sp. 4.1]|uniref:RelA/SpoT domain-containing protein n=1 Tax=Sanguibacter biliveldensis TaxID=3030830 RepID=A0AAF0ZAY5_9MICO|nr:hypothetical protein [Sanguibacter sp. 4.1]WPF83901.1 hypothetical protein SANBI_001611 [Sanguibacter sp. 4.1]